MESWRPRTRGERDREETAGKGKENENTFGKSVSSIYTRVHSSQRWGTSGSAEALLRHPDGVVDGGGAPSPADRSRAHSGQGAPHLERSPTTSATRAGGGAFVDATPGPVPGAVRPRGRGARRGARTGRGRHQWQRAHAPGKHRQESREVRSRASPTQQARRALYVIQPDGMLSGIPIVFRRAVALTHAPAPVASIDAGRA